MKNLPDRVLSHPGSEVPSRVEASSQGREIRLHEPRFLEAATERADSTVKPLRVALVEPVAYLCDSYMGGLTQSRKNASRRIQAIGGTGTFTPQDSQPCRLLPPVQRFKCGLAT